TVHRPGKEPRTYRRLKAVTDESGWGSSIEVPGAATAPILRKVWVTLPNDRGLVGLEGKLVLSGTVLFPVAAETPNTEAAFLVEKHELREEHPIRFATVEAKRKHQVALAGWRKEHKLW